MSEVFQFQPPPFKPSERAEVFAAALRQHPGRWAIYSEDAPGSLVTSINRGMTRGFTPAGHYEATGRTVATEPRRRFKVWVRAIPANERT